MSDEDQGLRRQIIDHCLRIAIIGCRRDHSRQAEAIVEP